MQLRQFEIQNGDVKDMVWLENIVKIGDKVTLADSLQPKTLWKIINAYAVIEAKDLKEGHDSHKVFGSIQGRSNRKE